MIFGQYYEFLEEQVKWMNLEGMLSAMECMVITGENPGGELCKRELVPVSVLV
jgi:hypothetical protein